MKSLYFMPSMPFPPHRGTSQRTDLLYRSLRSLGKVDTVLLLSKFEHAPDDEALSRLRREYGLLGLFHLRHRGEMGFWRHFRHFNPRHIDRLARALGNPAAEQQPDPTVQTWLADHLSKTRYDWIVGRYVQILAQSGALNQSAVPVALDIDDLPTEMCRSRLATNRTHGMPQLLERRRLFRLEQTLPERFARCSVLWVANDEHCAEPGLERAHHLPNVPYFPDGLPEPLPPDPKSKTIMFVGSFSHNPNLEGLERFLTNIWPKIRADQPDAHLLLVGSHMTATQRQRYARLPNVDPAGFVEDLRSAYSKAAICIVPIYVGSGTNIKVMEALAYGRPVVISGFAARGHLRILGGRDSPLIAQDDGRFANICVQLLQNDSARNSIAGHLRQQIATELSYTSFRATVEHCLITPKESAASILQPLSRTDHSPSEYEQISS